MKVKNCLTMILLLWANPLLAEVIIEEDFEDDVVPSEWVLVEGRGALTVEDGKLVMSPGPDHNVCVELPLSFSREENIRIEAVVSISDTNVGDFNYFFFYDPTNPVEREPSNQICHWIKNSGYNFSFAPNLSDTNNIFITSSLNSDITLLGVAPSNIAGSTWNLLASEVNSDGSLISEVNGDVAVSAFDNSLSSGKIYLRSWYESKIEYFRVVTSPSCRYGPEAQPILTERAKGRPTRISYVWESCGGEGVFSYLSRKVAAAKVYLNGVQILDTNDFNAANIAGDLGVNLYGGINQIDIELRGKPSSDLVFELQSRE